MPQRVYSKQIYIAHGITAGSFVIDPGYLGVIRTIAVSADSVILAYSASLVDNATGTTLWSGFADIVSGSAALFVPDCRIVINPGQIVDVNLLTLGDIALYGYLLTLP